MRLLEVCRKEVAKAIEFEPVPVAYDAQRQTSDFVGGYTVMATKTQDPFYTQKPDGTERIDNMIPDTDW